MAPQNYFRSGARRRVRRIAIPPASANRPPALAVASHGVASEAGFGAVPPSPVSTPPLGMAMLDDVEVPDTSASAQMMLRAALREGDNT